MSTTEQNPSASAPSLSSSSGMLPEIHLLCMNRRDSVAFGAAVMEHYPSLQSETKITVHNRMLHLLPEDVRFDAIVSPANSYARLDGSFDDAIARAFGPKGDYDWITRKAQKVLYEEWKGFAPPGTCTLVPIEDDDAERQPTIRAVPTTADSEDASPESDEESDLMDGEREIGAPLPWGCKYMLLCPTMRVPQGIKWDREVVYECVWSMLNTIEKHNRRTTSAPIKSILMTPLGTGVGGYPIKRWAQQCVLAMKHFVEATVEEPEKWAHLEWNEIFEHHEVVVDTYRDDDFCQED